MGTSRAMPVRQLRTATRRILYVNIAGGPQFGYVIRKLRDFGEVHVLQPEPISPAEEQQLRAATAHVDYVPGLPPGPALREHLAATIARIGADVVVSFDEFTVEDVSRVAGELGLRGPGPNVRRARRKTEIYRVLEAHGLLKRPYVASPDPQELLDADIPLPFVVKPAECCGSLGVFPVSTEDELRALPQRLAQAWETVLKVVSGLPAGKQLAAQCFIREGLLRGDAAGWFGPGTPFADYCSLEGMVINGRYHPLAITQDFPLAPPFVETASFTPCTLPPDRQIGIARRIAPCIEALGLQNCGTHTEIKLLPGGDFAVIETAARFSGSGVIRQIEEVFGIDPIGELAKALIDPRHEFTLHFEEILARRLGAAATIDLLPMDPDHTPWGDCVLRRAPEVAGVVHAGTRSECSLYVDPGQVLPAYDPLNGVWNCFGKLYLYARDAETLANDVQAVRAHLRNLVA